MLLMNATSKPLTSFFSIAALVICFAGVGPAKNYVSPLIQVIMFGMGTTLNLNDFARVLLVPKRAD